MSEVKYLDYEGLNLYHSLGKNYIDKKVTSSSIENDLIDEHDTLIITDGYYNSASGITEKTKVKVNIDNDTIVFRNVAGKFETLEEVDDYNLEHVGEDGFLQVSIGDDKPADYKLSIRSSALTLYIGTNSIDIGDDINGEKEVSLIVKPNDKVLSIDNQGLKSTLLLKKITTNVEQTYGSNVREAYILTGINDELIGDPILIYKDKTLKNVELTSPIVYNFEQYNSEETEKLGEGIATVLSIDNNKTTILINDELFIIDNLEENTLYQLQNSQEEDIFIKLSIKQDIEGKSFRYTYIKEDGSEKFVYLDISELWEDINSILDKIEENEYVIAAGFNDLNEKINGLATVATTGSYDDLLDVPNNLAYIDSTQESATTTSFDPQTDTVWTKTQTLSVASKTTARNNIGAQEVLVSGANIKTINDESLLGSGNISVISELPSNTAYLSNDSGDGIVPSDGIKAMTIASAASMIISPDVVTVINGEVGASVFTLRVPLDNLAHVWDILFTSAASGIPSFVMSDNSSIKYPSGYSVGTSKAIEISVIGVGTKYYLRYGEFT